MKKLITALSVALAVTSLTPIASYAQIGIGVGVAVNIAPPAIPIYVQPPIPAPNYLWTPGYWAWNGDDYYWVPGTWIEPPQVGFLWTPGYWGYGEGGGYFFHTGYWGPHIGFYGGINYGFGYGGEGYRGGYWNGGQFNYNRSVNNINVNIVHNTYNENIPQNGGNRVSFNGGNGGVNAQPTPAERQAANFPHTGPTAVQTQHIEAARADRSQFASVNHGAPPVAATARPGSFQGEGVVRATAAGAPVSREAARPGVTPGAPGGAARPPQSAEANAARAAAARPAVSPVARAAAPRPQPAARPAAPAVHQQAAPRPEPQAAPRPQPQAAPRPQAAPHPQASHEPAHGGGERQRR